MDSYKVVLDALILIWAFIYTIFVCRSGEGSGDAVQKTDASVHRLVRYLLHIHTIELAHFFTKRPFSYV